MATIQNFKLSSMPKISPRELVNHLGLHFPIAKEISAGLSVLPGNIVVDSRKVARGDIFIAIDGITSDGHQFVAQAAASGASLILAERLPNESITAPIVIVSSSRSAWSYACAHAWNDPQNLLKIIAVTGTNGKTSTVWFIRELMKVSGINCATIGTLGFYCGNEHLETGHTTPDPPVLYGLLRLAADANVVHIAMETSSHAIAQKKLEPIKFSAAAFTSFTQDHLDFHGTMENYFSTKLELFSRFLTPNAKSFFHDTVWSLIKNQDFPFKPVVYGDQGSDISLLSSLTIMGSSTQIKIESTAGVSSAEMPIIGKVFAENFMVAAALTANLLETTIPMLLRKIKSKSILPVPGRMNPIASELIGRPLVLVDSAHTPDALKKALEISRQVTRGQLAVVFGCGGDRDPTKRPIMGKIAEDYADAVYLTSDNSRSESTEDIIHSIKSGVRRNENIFEEADRSLAIQNAIMSCSTGDTVLIAGKGHEDYQIIGGAKKHFLDSQEAERSLRMSKRWCVVGGGLSGISAAKKLRQQGDEVFLSDSGKFGDELKLELKGLAITGQDGGHELAHLEGAHAVVMSPGIAPANIMFIQALASKVSIRTEIDLGLEKYQGTIFAVTGTNGKSTVCAMLEHATRSLQSVAIACGNFGVPPTALDFEIYNASSVLALELSSYQLEVSLPVEANVAIITSFSIDHLARHGTLQDYLRAKWRVILKLQRDGLFVLRGSVLKAALEYKFPLPACKIITILDGSEELQEVAFSELTHSDLEYWWVTKSGVENKVGVVLPAAGFGESGTHNMINSAFCFAALRHNHRFSSEEIPKALASFKGLPHRCELIGFTSLGLKIINDSKSTNIESTIAALSSIDGKVVLLLGGVGKDEPYFPLLQFREKISLLIAFGKSSATIVKEIGDSFDCKSFTSMKEACHYAFQYSSKNSSHILLSPAGASFDEFRNFEHRGEQFKIWMSELEV